MEWWAVVVTAGPRASAALKGWWVTDCVTVRCVPGRSRFVPWFLVPSLLFLLLAFSHHCTLLSPLLPPRQAARPPGADGTTSPSGHYTFHSGDRFAGGRYAPDSVAGRGVFATVLAGTDHGVSPPRRVAIKLLRANDAMRRAGASEVAVLHAIAAAAGASAGTAPADHAGHCAVLLDSFLHRGHLALVFPLACGTLRDALEAYGAGTGLALEAVRLYGRQLFSALATLRAARVVHGDIKPDNVLLSADRATATLADFGSAWVEAPPPAGAEVGEGAAAAAAAVAAPPLPRAGTGVAVGAAAGASSPTTPYLVSRFYRAPEIALRFPRGPPADGHVWSVGCVLYELCTGHLPLPSTDKVDLLRRVATLRGGRGGGGSLRGCSVPPRAAATGLASALAGALPPPTQPGVVVVVAGIATAAAAEAGAGGGEGGAVVGGAAALADLIDRCVVVYPRRRFGVDEALAHP